MYQAMKVSCVIVVSILLLSAILIFDFGIVSTESIIGLAALLIDWVSDCCLMQKSYMMIITSYNSMRWWWYPLCADVELPNEMITNNVEDQPGFNSDKFREKDENVKS